MKPSLSLEQIRRLVDTEQPITAEFLKALRRDPRQGARRLCALLEKRHDKEHSERIRIRGILTFESILWKSGVRAIAGVDEVGVGPLAGPVVAAAVVFAPGTELRGVNDSKRLDPDKRCKMEAEIRATATGVSIGMAEVAEIDRMNIYHASLLAMRRAVEALPLKPEHLLIDARTIPDLSIPQTAIIKGDGSHFSIAAASIIAKTYRDRLMDELDKTYPGYGFGRHKGYGTPEHQSAIRRLGPSPIHRMSYQIVRELCGECSESFYSLKRTLEAAGSRTSLGAFEETLKVRSAKLDENERRKLKTMLSRRWRTI